MVVVVVIVMVMVVVNDQWSLVIVKIQSQSLFLVELQLCPVSECCGPLFMSKKPTHNKYPTRPLLMSQCKKIQEKEIQKYKIQKFFAQETQVQPGLYLYHYAKIFLTKTNSRKHNRQVP